MTRAVALLASLFLAPVLGTLAFRATASPSLTEPYPPADWRQRAFSGVITSPPPPRGTKPRWITVRQPDGSEVQSPLAVQDKLPIRGEVRKRAGQLELEFRDAPSAPWQKILPEDGSQRDAQALLLWLAWSGGAFALLGGLSWGLLRRRSAHLSADPHP